MAYEIPSALRYEERVVFGLTFRQFAYLILFGVLSAIIVLKTNIAMEVKVVSSIALMGFAVSSAFFNLDKYIVDVATYLSGMREVGYLDKKALELMDVKDVLNDIIILNNGIKLAIVHCFPINLSVKSKEEREMIVKSFSEFLNALSFPIQINIRTVDSLKELRSYFDSFEQRITKPSNNSNHRQIIEFFHEHRRFFEEYVGENAIKNRLFYVIIPFNSHSEHEKALKELNIRVEIVKEKLEACGISSERLNTLQLISLLASYFEEFVEVEKDYVFPITMLKRYITTKGERFDKRTR